MGLWGFKLFVDKKRTKTNPNPNESGLVFITNYNFTFNPEQDMNGICRIYSLVWWFVVQQTIGFWEEGAEYVVQLLIWHWGLFYQNALTVISSVWSPIKGQLKQENASALVWEFKFSPNDKCKLVRWIAYKTKIILG